MHELKEQFKFKVSNILNILLLPFMLAVIVITVPVLLLTVHINYKKDNRIREVLK